MSLNNIKLKLLILAYNISLHFPDHTRLVSSSAGSDNDDSSSGLVSYEVLPAGFGGHPAAAFLITQPRSGDDNAGEEPGGSAGEHIIMLPLAAQGTTEGTDAQVATGKFLLFS